MSLAFVAVALYRKVAPEIDNGKARHDALDDAPQRATVSAPATPHPSTSYSIASPSSPTFSISSSYAPSTPSALSLLRARHRTASGATVSSRASTSSKRTASDTYFTPYRTSPVAPLLSRSTSSDHHSHSTASTSSSTSSPGLTQEPFPQAIISAEHSALSPREDRIHDGISTPRAERSATKGLSPKSPSYASYLQQNPPSFLSQDPSQPPVSNARTRTLSVTLPDSPPSTPTKSSRPSDNTPVSPKSLKKKRSLSSFFARKDKDSTPKKEGMTASERLRKSLSGVGSKR